MRRTSDEAAATRRRILRSAEAVFIEKGYDEASLQEIAAEAAVTTGAIQWHFGQKMHILLALRDELCWQARKLGRLHDAGMVEKPLKAVAEFATSAINYFADNENCRRIFQIYDRKVSDTVAFHNEDRKFQQEVRATLGNVFGSAETRKELLAPWTSDTAAYTFWFAMRGTFQTWLEDDSTFDLKSDGMRIVQTMLSSYQRADLVTG
ncbi:TetR/AcrR family transcriptional regulator [Agrobacterium tumefaciens]|uniref:Riorf51 protein n=2 Tax=Rhizobium/Agrobacterium group TaxID=227290 RepID=Q9KWD3_RHIRH|nr:MULTISPECIES: TetR/AcrR family transcriptional regulator [Agrobacterium]ASK42931.1 TetR family transcriptional regulator [Rhizobium rhizogenes]MCZ7977736.1 TetR/AcrR family transcriptional regulator [Agrobacterium salinitolerans]MDA5243330.1 TetR/AcrR family transcriptional regulator [Agrobacterium sp. MAFF310724]MDA5250308.1 TetR/AcrR family transcriptional regulator [Agrobacterium sp. MAFF210268]TRA98531.1 TetR/AcrR family transcriptional regulator [Agrobacterium tumefaciens]